MKVVVTDDAVLIETPMGGNVYSHQLVITKDAFIECYQKWIMEQSTMGQLNPEPPVNNLTHCQDCYYYENSQCMRVELVDDGEHWDSRLWQPDDFCSYAVPREVTIENDGTYEVGE